MFFEPKGRDWGSVVNWDDLAKIYAVLTVSWTLLLLLGVVWLILNRNLGSIRIRNLPLAISSTVFLHIYLVKICLAYTTNGHFLCSAEYWIMSIYLPVGIALYQAYLVQLRSLWEQQQKLVSSGESLHEKGKGILHRWRSLSSLRKSYCFIGLGMLVQLIITTVLYATTPTLQGDWSSYGNVSHAKGQGLCRKSLPWIPSAFWQLFFSWFYGPYTLIKTRNIHDIHFWRAQVIISVIAGLPGAPIWLASLYAPEFKPINRRFVPPMWLAPGIVVIQFVTIFFPVFKHWQSKRQLQNTISLLRAWDEQSQVSDHSYQSSLGKLTPKTSMSIVRPVIAAAPDPDTRINTMASLRKALSVNPAPLLHFAATRDFTAENIVFLMRVREWRSAWVTAPVVDMEISPSAFANLFNMAVDIYSSLVDDRTAKFPINIEDKVRRKLDDIFASAAAVTDSRSSSDSEDQQTLFGSASAKSDVAPIGHIELNHKGSKGGSSDSSPGSPVLPSVWGVQIQATAIATPTTTVLEEKPTAVFAPHPCVRPLGGAKGVIREGFGKDVFDEAEKSIEYLVLTNTWQKFVGDGNARRIAGEILRERSVTV